MLVMHVIKFPGIIIISYAALLDFFLFALALRMHSIFLPSSFLSVNSATVFMNYNPTPDASDFAEKEDAGVTG